MGGPYQAGLLLRTGMPQFGGNRCQRGNVGIGITFLLAFDVGGGEYQGAGEGIDMLLRQ